MSQSSSTNVNQEKNNPSNSSEFYLPPNKTGKKTLVLDLDETLVHSQFGPFDIPSDVVINIEIENEVHDIHVLVRPGVNEFLDNISKKFEVVIFTASISKYAGPLLDILDKNKNCSYRLFREHCTLINTSFVKDLKKLGRDLKDVIIVDNSPMAYLLNNDNGLPILTWFDNKNDRELYKISPILEFLSLVPDVRDYISKMVVNNEISYKSAMKIINDYNEMLNKKQKEKHENQNEDNAKQTNNEINENSDKNLLLINKEKKQQININIINNNITNYIYDNKNQDKKENINNNSNNYSNKNEKNKFNPNNIIASVNKPNISPKMPTLSSLIKEKHITKNKNSNSMKNINNNKVYLNKNNLNIGLGQYNTNNYIYKKSESIGIEYKKWSKKTKVESLHADMNNYFNNNRKNILNNKKNNSPIRNNTYYSSKSYNKKNMNNKRDNKMTKSAKSSKNSLKNLISNNNKNISVNRKYINKSNSKNKHVKTQIRLYNEGNMTTVHKKQKSSINFNISKDKSYRNNNNDKKNNKANELLHSVDLVKNNVATYYHNDNFPLFKKDNNKEGITNKNNRNRNKFLKTGKIVKKKYNYSPSREKEKNNNKMINIDSNISNTQKIDNIAYITNTKFNNVQKKINNNGQFKLSHAIQKEKNTDINKNDKNSVNTNTNQFLTENLNNNNSAININNYHNINNNIKFNHFYIKNQRSESMKNLTGTNNNNIYNNKFNINTDKQKRINNSTNQRPKSSNIFKKTKDYSKKKEIKRNGSKKDDKFVKALKYNIFEILERRGITKTNRIKDFNQDLKFNLNNKFIAINPNYNTTIRNKSKTFIKNE